MKSNPTVSDEEYEQMEAVIHEHRQFFEFSSHTDVSAEDHPEGEILIGPMPVPLDSAANAFLTIPLDPHERTDRSTQFDNNSEEIIGHIPTQFSSLSRMARRLQDTIYEQTRDKHDISYPVAFTGRHIVSAIHRQIQHDLETNHGTKITNRLLALYIARSLQNRLLFFGVDWEHRVVRDDDSDVYMFPDDDPDLYMFLKGKNTWDVLSDGEQQPTGVITVLSACYSPRCADSVPCYAFSCPRKGIPSSVSCDLHTKVAKLQEEEPAVTEHLLSLSQNALNRQRIIDMLFARENKFLESLDLIEILFINPLRDGHASIIPTHLLQNFIHDVFGNVLDLRECTRHLLDLMAHGLATGPLTHRIGDIFFVAMLEVQPVHQIYIPNYAQSQERLRKEINSNSDFRQFLQRHSPQQLTRHGRPLQLYLIHLLKRPIDHLQKTSIILQWLVSQTPINDSDSVPLAKAIALIHSMLTQSKIHTLQSEMGIIPPRSWGWIDTIPARIKQRLTNIKETIRQSVIFEFIESEMTYLKHLEDINNMYIITLAQADPPIIAPDELHQFIFDVFYNYATIYEHQRNLIENLCAMQRAQHPFLSSIASLLFDAVIGFKDAYIAYALNFRIAEYRIDDELFKNSAFLTFVEQYKSHHARRLDLKNLLHEPISHLPTYKLYLDRILSETPPEHDDVNIIPNIINELNNVIKDMDWTVPEASGEPFHSAHNISHEPWEWMDLDLSNSRRFLVHSGELYIGTEAGRRSKTRHALYVFLFDNCLVMTKPEEYGGETKYVVHKQPILLDLLRHSFTNTIQRSPTDPVLHLLTLYCDGRLAHLRLCARSAATVNEWKQKLDEATEMRKAAVKAFEVRKISKNTIPMPLKARDKAQQWSNMGKVICAVPFTHPDGRSFLVLGCNDGIWAGLPDEPTSFRLIIALDMARRCAVLEDNRLLLVLTKEALYAYRLESLVPSPSPQTQPSRESPRIVSKAKNIICFQVGTCDHRTVIAFIYTRPTDCVLRLLEVKQAPLDESSNVPGVISSRLSFLSPRSDWFKQFRDFLLPIAEYHDIAFLSPWDILLTCDGQFLSIRVHDGSKPAPFPPPENFAYLRRQKKWKPSRALGMFRSGVDEFLLCYEDFGLFFNIHGDPCGSGEPIKWEWSARSAAMSWPYFLLFNDFFIEIRHLQSGLLEQVVRGFHARCISDGRELHPHTDVSNDQSPDTKQIYFVMMDEARINHDLHTGMTQVVGMLVQVQTPSSSPLPRRSYSTVVSAASSRTVSTEYGVFYISRMSVESSIRE
ncbi:hypothetical protein GALMADRAFT_252035 [Galerina marginata CBS 339.88]|uniref:DH domain-containing protein n=1 Tax=Galerina marginata (strain CBS 339.88) TaxID=685588 RepID=A0A067SYJ9_GALM3|nr:hypothetical protein GALMADRAFT_252035 [Galerina marginata CBS 339.88]